MLKKAVIVAGIAVCVLLVKKFANGPSCDVDADLTGKVIIVTGANTGIGKQTVIDLVSKGAKVYMACRSESRCSQAAADVRAATNPPADRVVVMTLDLGSLKSVRKFAADFKTREKKLHTLINNAGVMLVPFGRTEDGFETHMGINHFGHFLLTNLLLDMLKQSKPSRVVNVSSMAGLYGSGKIHFDDMDLQKQGYGSGFEAYSQSKLANILFSLELAKRLKGSGVTSYSLHPGGIATDLQRNVLDYGIIGEIIRKGFIYASWPVWKDIPHGAATQVCCAIDQKLRDDSGLFYKDVAVYDPPAFAKDEETAQKLWTLSEKLTGLH